MISQWRRRPSRPLAARSPHVAAAALKAAFMNHGRGASESATPMTGIVMAARCGCNQEEECRISSLGVVGHGGHFASRPAVLTDEERGVPLPVGASYPVIPSPQVVMATVARTLADETAAVTPSRTVLCTGASSPQGK